MSGCRTAKRHASADAIGHTERIFDLITLLLGVIPAALQGRRDLVLENLLLRHQLAILTRPTRKHPRLRAHDKLVWVLARLVRRDWCQHLVFIGHARRELVHVNVTASPTAA